MAKQGAARAGLTPLATFKSFAAAGVDPQVMGIGPVPAATLALKKVRRGGTRITRLEGGVGPIRRG
eukprot:1030482-Prorocentrum_minimum.AAC.1